MTLQEYINIVNGEQIEAGGTADALYQCVDLANDYIARVLGLPKILWTDAKDFITKGVASGFYEKVTTPQPGDIAVWNWGDYGHIAIYVGNGQYLTQNYPLIQRTTISNLGTNGLIGYMRKKGGNVTQEEQKLFDYLGERVRHFEAKEAEYQKLFDYLGERVRFFEANLKSEITEDDRRLLDKLKATIKY